MPTINAFEAVVGLVWFYFRINQQFKRGFNFLIHQNKSNTFISIVCFAFKFCDSDAFCNSLTL